MFADHEAIVIRVGNGGKQRPDNALVLSCDQGDGVGRVGEAGVIGAQKAPAEAGEQAKLQVLAVQRGRGREIVVSGSLDTEHDASFQAPRRLMTGRLMAEHDRRSIISG